MDLHIDLSIKNIKTCRQCPFCFRPNDNQLGCHWIWKLIVATKDPAACPPVPDWCPFIVNLDWRPLVSE